MKERREIERDIKKNIRIIRKYLEIEISDRLESFMILIEKMNGEQISEMVLRLQVIINK